MSVIDEGVDIVYHNEIQLFGVSYPNQRSLRNNAFFDCYMTRKLDFMVRPSTNFPQTHTMILI